MAQHQLKAASPRARGVVLQNPDLKITQQVIPGHPSSEMGGEEAEELREPLKEHGHHRFSEKRSWSVTNTADTVLQTCSQEENQDCLTWS